MEDRLAVISCRQIHAFARAGVICGYDITGIGLS